MKIVEAISQPINIGENTWHSKGDRKQTARLVENFCNPQLSLLF